MQFEQHVPVGSLGRAVEQIIYYKGFQPGHTQERVVPTGRLFLVGEFDGMTRHVYDNDSLNSIDTFKGFWISGAHKEYLTISAHPDSEMMAVQLAPGYAPSILQQSIFELSNRVTPADAVFGNEIQTCHKNIQSAKTAEEKIKLMLNFLEERFSEQHVPPEYVSEAVILLNNESGDEQSISEIAGRSGISHKHLIKQFKAFVGLTPKQYQQIQRFNRILARISANERMNWSELSHMGGFSDQAHFIREFKRFSGFIPRTFVQDHPDNIGNFFPID